MQGKKVIFSIMKALVRISSHDKEAKNISNQFESIKNRHRSDFVIFL